MRRWNHRWCAAPLIAAILLWIMTAAVWAGDQRVFDQAGLFAPEETARFEEQIDGLREKMKMDVVLVTTASADGKSAEEYADDFYDQGGFGTRKDYSGALFLIDMDNREIYISTSGTMTRFLTDSRVETMLDHAYDYASSGDYAGASRQFLDDVADYYQKGIPGGQYNYDTETGKISVYRSVRWYEALLSLLASAFCAGGACLNVKRNYAMKEERSRASNFNMAYRATSQFDFKDQNDALINSFVTQQLIQRAINGGGRGMGGGGMGGAGRSSTHMSSGGRSHGGGGRKF